MFSSRLVLLLLDLLIVFCIPSVVQAELELSPLFSDHAVLQRDRPIAVWGWAEPNEELEVGLGDESAKATADHNGRWQVTLQARAASKDPLTLTVLSRTTGQRLDRKDLLIGDVWLCSGQSNMEWPLVLCNVPEVIEKTDLPLLRHFAVDYHFASHPTEKLRGAWFQANPQSVGNFTAVGFYFARRLQSELDIPIGIIRSAVGGTNIELWMSQETLLNTPTLEPYALTMRESLSKYRKQLAKMLPDIEAWQQESRKALATNGEIPLPPAWPDFPFSERIAQPRCVTLHNGMIQPLVPFQMRGAIWYQGESNAGDQLAGEQYIEKQKALVKDWKQWFGGDDFPFYYVQLASWQAADDNPSTFDSWGMFRDAQRRLMAEANTGMAVTIDIGDANDIHPKNKQDVGERLARWALAKTYQKPIVYSGPIFRTAVVEGSIIRCHFDSVGGGLMVGEKVGLNPAKEAPAEKLKRFAISGEDGQWYWADARIDGETVICSHPKVNKPIAVRYACSINPAGANLYNRTGLPASPFDYRVQP